jgi:hypothetical protein
MNRGRRGEACACWKKKETVIGKWGWWVEREWSCGRSFDRLLRIAREQGHTSTSLFVMCSLWHWSAAFTFKTNIQISAWTDCTPIHSDPVNVGTITK